MGKKSSLPLIYLIGVLLVAIGFCCPLFSGKILKVTANGFKFINFKNFGWSTIAALMIFCGAVAGVILPAVQFSLSNIMITVLQEHLENSTLNIWQSVFI